MRQCQVDLPRVAALVANTEFWRQTYGTGYLFNVEKEDQMQGDKLGAKPTRLIPPIAKEDQWEYYCPLCKLWWLSPNLLENYVEVCSECRSRLPAKSKV